MTPTEYRQARMCLLAFPRAANTWVTQSITDDTDRFSAEGEDFATLQDALQLYGEHAAREYARVLTRQRIKQRGYDAIGRPVRSVAQLQARLISDTVGIVCCDGLLTDAPSAVY